MSQPLPSSKQLTASAELAAAHPSTLRRLLGQVGDVLVKKGGKVIPFIGTGVGVGLAASEAHAGNYAGALVEAAGASEIPIVAQVADIGSLAADVGWAVKDVLDPQQRLEQWWFNTVLR